LKTDLPDAIQGDAKQSCSVKLLSPVKKALGADEIVSMMGE